MNKALLWDMPWTEADYETDAFRRWYYARVLERGTAAEVRELDFKLIARWLPDMRIPRTVREFWEWYLSCSNVPGTDSHPTPARTARPA
ncbi:MAG: hypothetical protein AAB152_02545 [Candidatus Coatesbacteria bacterium]